MHVPAEADNTHPMMIHECDIYMIHECACRGRQYLPETTALTAGLVYRQYDGADSTNAPGSADDCLEWIGGCGCGTTDSPMA